jgi:hypothetical protein
MFAQLLSIKVKVKVDLSIYSPLDIWEGAGTATIILNFGTRCRRVPSLTHWPFNRRERVTDTHGIGGSVNSRAGMDFWRKEKLPLGLTTLSRLLV